MLISESLHLMDFLSCCWLNSDWSNSLRKYAPKKHTSKAEASIRTARSSVNWWAKFETIAVMMTKRLIFRFSSAEVRKLIISKKTNKEKNWLNSYLMRSSQRRVGYHSPQILCHQLRIYDSNLWCSMHSATYIT